MEFSSLFAISYKRRPEHRADDLELHGVQEGVVAVPDREVEQGGVGGELWVSEGQSHTAGEGTCTALYYTVLYCTVLHCTVLYCTVLYCTVLYCTVLYCTVLYCTVLYCTVLYC